MKRGHLLLGIGFFLSLLRLHAALPEWIEGLVKTTVGEYPSEAGSVVLLDETLISVKSNGAEKRSFRFAVRILKDSGVSSARVTAWRNSKDEKFSDGDAWVIRGGKQYFPSPEPKWSVRQDLDENKIQSERIKHTLSYTEVVRAGDIFAVEWTQTRTPLFAEDTLLWSAEGPIEREAVEIRLPAKWTLTATPRKDGDLQTESNGVNNVWRWSHRAPTLLANEESAPHRDTVAAALLVRIKPAVLVSGSWIQFPDWESCGRWAEELNAPSFAATPALQTRAAELAASSEGSRLGELKALAAFVQKIPYASIEKGLGIGLGYQARPATEVLESRLGDCKDKANLFRVLCAQRGFKTHMVLTLTDSADSFDDTWFSPAQFDHAIAAVAVDEPSAGTGYVHSEKFGSLLFFDATSEYALLGDLPRALEGKPALIIDGAKTELLRLPLGEEKSRYLTHQKASLKLDIQGRAEGTLVLRAEGASGQYMRAVARTETADQLKNRYTSRLTKAVKAVELKSLEHGELPERNGYATTIKFNAPSYGQAMPGGLLLIRLDVFGAVPIPSFPATKRERGIDRDPYTIEEKIELTLAEGITVVEVPKDTELSSEFGTYRCRWKLEQGVLRAEREIFWRRIDLPAAKYAEFKAYIAKVTRAHGSSILVRLP